MKDVRQLGKNLKIVVELYKNKRSEIKENKIIPSIDIKYFLVFNV